MRILLVIGLSLMLIACADGPAQDLSPDEKAYWDAVNDVPGARTGEADYYFAHRGGIFSTGFSPYHGGGAFTGGTAAGPAFNR